MDRRNLDHCRNHFPTLLDTSIFFSLSGHFCPLLDCSRRLLPYQRGVIDLEDLYKRAENTGSRKGSILVPSLPGPWICRLLGFFADVDEKCCKSRQLSLATGFLFAKSDLGRFDLLSLRK